MPDPPGFADFYAAEVPRLLLFLYKQGAGWDEGWDATQEAFLAALRHWGGIRNPSAWIRTTALRAHLRQRRRPGDDLRRAASSIEWLPRPKFADLELGAQEEEVLDAIAGLPLRQRQVMAWHYDGYSTVEIASILELNTDAVRASLYQARVHLKRRLAAMIETQATAQESAEGGAA